METTIVRRTLGGLTSIQEFQSQDARELEQFPLENFSYLTTGYRGIEAMSYHVRAYLKDYFKIMISHASVGKIANLKDNGVYPYLEVLKRSYVNVVETKEFSIPTQGVHAYFFDNTENFMTKVKVSATGVGMPVVKIIVNGNFFGYYCRERNILICTDFTHFFYDDHIDIMNNLFNEIDIKLRVPEIVDEPIPSITIGCDPELEECSSSDEYFPRSATIREGLSAEIGRDGSGSQIEIRPKYGNTAHELVQHIAALFLKIPHPVSVKGDKFPLGGHIHFGFPEDSALVDALDYFLGYPFQNLNGSARGSYKNLHSYRSQPWGFEYRSLPSAWLFNPKISEIVLSIAYGLGVKSRMQKIYSYEFDTQTHRVSDKYYLDFISKDDLDYFKAFVSNYFAYDGKPINTNWVNDSIAVEIPKPQPRLVNIEFSDSWNDVIKRMIIDKITQENVMAMSNYRVILFGFREDRGHVANYHSNFFEFKGDSPSYRDGNNSVLYIGLPYSFRTLADGVENTKLEMDEIIDFIRSWVNTNTEGGK